MTGEHLDELALLCEGAVAEPWPTGDDDVVEGLKANLAAIRLYQQTLAGATALDEALAGLRTHYRPYGEYMPALIPFYWIICKRADDGCRSGTARTASVQRLVATAHLSALGNGHIHRTYLVEVNKPNKDRFVLQAANSEVFADPVTLTEQMLPLLEHLSADADYSKT
ncbi:MAG: hypothetical protein CM15mP68_4770 [Pseudomonadota bacterium]|nr:MAG: hypothetical protein CM15mP68_4770 [Pseudomonadota bacterium]